MLENMNLFTSSIVPQDISKFYKYENFSWGNQFDYIRHSIKEIQKTLSITKFNEEHRKVFLITENLRYKNECEAHRFYYTFYLKLTKEFYEIEDKNERDTVYAFTQRIDYTELFYNISQLLGNLGNDDMAIYYISLADKEYAVKNNVVEGDFLKLLLNSKSHFLWNVSSQLICDYQNFENVNGHTSNFKNTLSSFNIDINRKTLDEFYKGVDIQTLFQLIDSFKRFNKLNLSANEKERGTRYRSIYIYKVLGDFTWAFENYLKTSILIIYKKDMSHTSLKDLLTYTLKKIDKRSSRYFSTKLSSLECKYTNKYDLNTKGLQELIIDMNSITNDKYDAISHFALILYLFRNYSTHYMDNTLNLGFSYTLKLSIYLSIVTTFLITNDLFDKHKKIHE